MDAATYDSAKQLARSRDIRVRRRLATDPATQPEILYFLADDPAPEVRREIAENAGTPWQAADILANDDDTDVRIALAEKLARLTPTLSVEARANVYRQATRALEQLARDQFRRVREVLAGALRDVVDAPRDVVRRLAGDAEISVCAPVLEYSPVLTDADLLEIVACSAAAGAHSAISRRRHVSAIVSDAIVEKADDDAITALLANESAQIREETLDLLLNRATDVTAWHAPLVRRPRISASAAQRIAGFVAERLLDELSARLDLDATTTKAIAAVVQARIRDPAAGGGRGKVDPNWAAAEDPHERVLQLHADGKLSENSIVEALLRGDKRFAAVALSVAAGVGDGDVARIVSAHNAKGIVALTWKAEFSMKLAMRLQMQLGGIAPAAVLRAPADGSFPLTPDEMEWQLEFLSA